MDKERFTAICDELGYDNELLGQIFGVTTRTIYNYKNGKREVPRAVALLLERKVADRKFDEQFSGISK